ncbi:hypothetical protein AURDEDRAFT_157927 [Auricularia subglabra TFB-10046 SS5]|nr:hypothetical protein AURDEDRAFT_157927 [Auricularia subglabra TFB-10046 SS5]
MLAALGRIHTLRLGACTAETTQLVRIMRLLPCLRVADLRTLTFADPLTLLVSIKSRVLFDEFGAFTALRILRVNADMLPAVRIAPPHLEELAVSISPYSDQAGFIGVRMRSVALWDDIKLAHLPVWRVPGFMLHEMLKPAGIDVVVNLS